MASRNGIFFSPRLSWKGKIWGLDIVLHTCALENKPLNQNCWSWYHFSNEKLLHTLIPVIASTYCGKYPIPGFFCATLYSILLNMIVNTIYPLCENALRSPPDFSFDLVELRWVFLAVLCPRLCVLGIPIAFPPISGFLISYVFYSSASATCLDFMLVEHRLSFTTSSWIWSFDAVLHSQTFFHAIFQNYCHFLLIVIHNL